MAEPDKPTRRGPSVENLLQRQEYAQLMIASHSRWLRETDNRELRLLHHALIDSFQTVIAQYNVLLDVLNHKP